MASHTFGTSPRPTRPSPRTRRARPKGLPTRAPPTAVWHRGHLRYGNRSHSRRISFGKFLPRNERTKGTDYGRCPAGRSFRAAAGGDGLPLQIYAGRAAGQKQTSPRSSVRLLAGETVADKVQGAGLRPALRAWQCHSAVGSGGEPESLIGREVASP
jgi:hypothetical protein